MRRVNASRVALVVPLLLLSAGVPRALAEPRALRSGPLRAARNGDSTSVAKTRGKRSSRTASTASAPIEPAPAESAPAASEPLPMPPPPVATVAPPEPKLLPAVPAAERAWAKGVSPKDQKEALDLFQAGNALLKESVFVQASEKYRRALELWSHPAIHYNLALALMNLDQPIEVHEHLVAALRFGSEPLEAEKYEYARNYKVLIEKQLSRVDVTCDTPGAAVLLDGKPLFRAPGHYSGLVRPGPHTLAATHQGYLPYDQSRTLLPGEEASFSMKLFTSEELTRYRRRFATAVPWLVMGAGAALAGGSAWMHVQARERFRTFDTGISDCGGCVPSSPVAAQLQQGQLLQGSAIAGYALGGAALVTGAILASLNQPQPYRIDPSQVLLQPEHVSIAPVLGGGTRGVQALVRF